MNSIAYITNSSPDSGVGHRASNIARHLLIEQDFKLSKFHMDGESCTLKKDDKTIKTLHKLPRALGAKTMGWLRLGYVLKPMLSDYDLLHLTNQTLGFISLKDHPTVITVHDIIELTDPQSVPGGLLAKYLYRGINRANHIITVSKYTAQQLINIYQISADKISVIPNGVDPKYHPIPNFKMSIAYWQLHQEMKIPVSAKIVLYVGSDHPRKNVSGAIQAFAQALRIDTELIFIKVGSPGLATGRQNLLDTIDNLGIKQNVRIINNITEDKLIEIYNLATVFIYPSRQEGFGLPPLQAMACGTPVITSNAASLPEVMGDAAITHHPDDVDGMGKSIISVLEDSVLASQLTVAGVDRAKRFNWINSANQVANVYRQVIKTAK
jgi:glycosyltransferase involved in cell wall biosynthesis